MGLPQTGWLRASVRGPLEHGVEWVCVCCVYRVCAPLYCTVPVQLFCGETGPVSGLSFFICPMGMWSLPVVCLPSPCWHR